MRNLYLLPSSPLDELRKQLPDAQIEFDAGISPAEAAPVARRADVAIVFAIRAEGEGFDIADLSLPSGQDELIAAVAAANPNTVVVLETGNPTVMPWRRLGERDRAGVVSGSGRWSGDRGNNCRPGESVGPAADHLPGRSRSDAAPTAARSRRAVRIADDHPLLRGRRRRLPLVRPNRPVPMFAFGHGLTYTSFEYHDLR